jgi:hypothetical protein
MSETTEIIERIEELTGWIIKPNRFKIFTDTSEWMNISRGNIIRLEGKDFLVRGNMREPRFGIDDQPKYWVFSAIELATGKEKIIKTVFNEEFYAHIGIFKIRCYRSPEKESETLNIFRGDMRFMQGYSCFDEANNNVRVIDYIRGIKIFHYIPNIPKTHKEYFDEDLPVILKNLFGSIMAIKDMHSKGLCHGDIRNDHIIIETGTGNYRWIDYDLKQDVTDFDLWSLGNIIAYAVGKGLRTFDTVKKSTEFSNDIKQSLTFEDSSAFYQYRIMNLKKLYPYIPDKLSNILNHFTIRPKSYYSSLDEFISQYKEMLESEFAL